MTYEIQPQQMPKPLGYTQNISHQISMQTPQRGPGKRQISQIS